MKPRWKTMGALIAAAGVALLLEKRRQRRLVGRDEPEHANNGRIL